ncbi:MAG TPA: hypothetical protein PKY01_01150 [Candidatus Hydrogenedentes bacterium]|nr:hypothetical protein [Candidatus Hydrogenedentota bacterium]HQH50998.1 hypothetical protein [Candidatus Hydrogenedentota bacterium]HQM49925.1 hypothetical protein [Candidatus Hydrogenedentota bacterium]
MSDQDPLNLAKRDSEAFLILGAFLAFLALVVLVATVFQAPGHARVVNCGAGLTLLLIGGGMAVWGRILRRRFSK